MSAADNTLLLRLAGPLQAWGTSSRFQIRRTDAYPSKSGVLGLLLCAMGVRRENSDTALARLLPLCMGVRVDRAGSSAWDYHTAGAKIGIRSADGKIKKTATTGEWETLLSRREYLYDASFLVALQGAPEIIETCVRALADPVWPVFLGRKCCVPAEPVHAGTGSFGSLAEALASVPWRPRVEWIDREDREPTRTLDVFLEHSPGSPPPADARLVHDVPRIFGYYSQDARWVVRGQVTVSIGEPTQPRAPRAQGRRVDYGSEQWKAARRDRLRYDHGRCVFCKSPADEVHHVDYAHVGQETHADLRSLCNLCHDACTMLEYGHGMQRRRIDPSDPAQRTLILRQIDRLLSERREGRRRELLESARNVAVTFFDDVPAARAGEGE
jgi:CRISPR system Cascade subunit CasD